MADQASVSLEDVFAGKHNSMSDFMSQVLSGQQAKSSLENTGKILTTRPSGPEDINKLLGVLGTIVPAASLKTGKEIAAYKELIKKLGLEETFKKTGIYSGPVDQKLRAVVNDVGASLKALPGPQGSLPLTATMSHPDLYSAVPSLASTRVVRAPWKNRASYASNLDTIFLGDYGGEQQNLSALLHEVQHALQNRAGFAQGSAPEHFHKFPEKFMDKLHKLNSDYQLAMDAVARNPSAENSAKLDKIGAALTKHLNAQDQSIQRYTKVAGEAEARAVQHQFERGRKLEDAAAVLGRPAPDITQMGSPLSFYPQMRFPVNPADVIQAPMPQWLVDALRGTSP